MTRRLFTATLIVLLMVCVPSSAALYEFTLRGDVTSGIGEPGEPVTISYVADSQDLHPNPARGAYNATAATYASPSLNLTSVGGELGVGVELNNPAGSDRVTYLHRDLHPYFRVDLTFPAGTLISDALPLTLPMASATSATFEIGWNGPFVRGNITSYSSVQVPEPMMVVGALLLTMLLRFRRGGYLSGKSLR